MKYRQACQVNQNLSKKSLLAMLHSSPNKDKGIIVATGEVVDLAGLPENTVKTYLRNGTLVYFEESQPRQMLLLQPNWAITSFDPLNRQVCVQIFAESGMRALNFTITDYAPKTI